MRVLGCPKIPASCAFMDCKSSFARHISIDVFACRVNRWIQTCFSSTCKFKLNLNVLNSRVTIILIVELKLRLQFNILSCYHVLLMAEVTSNQIYPFCRVKSRWAFSPHDVVISVVWGRHEWLRRHIFWKEMSVRTCHSFLFFFFDVRRYISQVHSRRWRCWVDSILILNFGSESTTWLYFHITIMNIY